MTKKSLKTVNVLFVSMLLTLTIALTGCSGDKEEKGSTQIAAKEETQITIGIAQDLNSLDPNEATGAGTKEILFNVYEGLYKPDSAGNLNPAVASDYSVSDDGLVYTFTLRDGVKFHNGNPVTVDDVKYTIEKCAGTETGTPLVSAFSNITSVETPDDKTVVITLAKENANFLALVATVETAIVPKDVANLGDTPVGTGPYKIVSRELQDRVELKKFDEYWGEPAHIDNITLKVLADADTYVMNLEGGAVDMVFRATTAQVSELSDKFYVEEGTMNLVQALFLNNNVEPFNNEKVRQAMSYAVDKQEILNIVADGKGTPIASNIFPSFKKYYTPELNDVYKTDLEKAKTLLAEAGYSDGFSFTIKAPSNYPQHVDTAVVLVEQLKKVGINAEIELIEWESWLSDVYSDRNFEATIVGLDASTLTAGALLSRFRSTAKNNFVNYNNPDYDAAYENAVNAKTDEEATKYYKECEKILCETAANLYIQDLAELVVISKKYAGYEFYPMYLQDFSKLYVVE